MRRRLTATVAGVAAVVLVVDQLTKSWALRRLSGGRSIHLFWTLDLRLALNRGGAFSLGTDSPWFFAVAAVVLVVALLAFGRRLRTRLGAVALGLVLGGALGNLSDRLFRGHGGAVVDWIDFGWW